MEKLLKAKAQLEEVKDLFGNADDSNEMFIRGTVARALDAVNNRIKSIKDAEQLSAPPQAEGKPKGRKK